jgi:hypothetical protein
MALRGELVTRRLLLTVREIEVESRVFILSILCRLRGLETSVSVDTVNWTSPTDSSSCDRCLVAGIEVVVWACAATALNCVVVDWLGLSTVADSRLGDGPRRVGQLSSAVFS